MDITANLPDTTLGPEWAALELSSIGLGTSDRVGLFRELLGYHNFDFGELLEQAIRHKLLPRLSRHMVAEDLQTIVPLQLRRYFRSALLQHQHRATIQLREGLRINDLLCAEGVEFAFTKGFIFEQLLFDAAGSRLMNDIDCMISPAAREIVTDLMHRAGFSQGYYDWTSHSIQLDRRTALKYRLNPDHLPHFTRVTGDPVIPTIAIDFANSLTWTNSPWHVPIEDVLASIVEIQCRTASATIPSLSPPYLLLFTILHLFREAWHEEKIRMGNDVDLSKFSDVYHLCHKIIVGESGAQFSRLVTELNLLQPVCWVLHHVDQVFGTEIAAGLGLSNQATAEWLASAHSARGIITWRGTMRQRLQTKDRKQLFDWKSS